MDGEFSENMDTIDDVPVESDISSESIDTSPTDITESTEISGDEGDIVRDLPEDIPEDISYEGLENDMTESSDIFSDYEEIKEDVNDGYVFQDSEHVEDIPDDIPEDVNDPNSSEEGAPIKVLTLGGNGTGHYKFNAEEEMAKIDEGYGNLQESYQEDIMGLKDEFEDIKTSDDMSNQDKISQLKDLRERAVEVNYGYNDMMSEWQDARSEVERRANE